MSGQGGCDTAVLGQESAQIEYEAAAMGCEIPTHNTEEDTPSCRSQEDLKAQSKLGMRLNDRLSGLTEQLCLFQPKL